MFICLIIADKFKFMMKRIVLLFFPIIVISCGIIEDTTDETVTYTYILKNETGVELQITSDFGRMEFISNGSSYRCETVANPGYLGGLCSGELEIRIPNTNMGYQCFGLGSDAKGLCFIEDNKLFVISNNTAFTEIGIRTYEYVLTPNLLESTFELP